MKKNIIEPAFLSEAADRIRPHIHRTPLLSSEILSHKWEVDVRFKCEQFQKVGAFKARGAMNAALMLSDSERNRGLCTHSSGNHGQAVAWAAKKLGVPSVVVMPSNAPRIKKEAVIGYGAEVISCEPTMESRESTLQKVVEDRGMTFIHPYDQWPTILGQSSCAREILEDWDPDLIMAPIGGGGLLSGTALTTSVISPKTRVIGAEPEGADDAFRSMRSGHPEVNKKTQTIADGLRTNIGHLTFSILRDLNIPIGTVSEEEILEALKEMWTYTKWLIEPSAAVPVALLKKLAPEWKGKKVAVILSGGNMDLEPRSLFRG